MAGRTARAATQRLGRGGGTALPGLVASRLAPNLIGNLASALGQGTVTVTGTNGKTTTAHLLALIAERHGLRVLANRSGSNMERGLISAFVDAAGPSGNLPDLTDHIGIFEVDEAALPGLYPALRPRLALFLNLFRDQLDRYGEVDSVAGGWATMLQADGGATALALNVDDPSVAALAAGARGPVIGFGIEDAGMALETPEHAADARFHHCGGPYAYDATYTGHVGLWRCDRCGARRPAPIVAATNVEAGADGTAFDLVIDGASERVMLPLAGLYSVYNALGAAAAAYGLGVPAVTIAGALRNAAPAFGRQERFVIDGREVRVLLAKNPAGLNEVLRALHLAARDGVPLSLLMLLNDEIQDGHDVSWIYDADLETLAGRVGVLVASGGRAHDLALRLVLAGMEPAVVEPEPGRALEAALRLTPPGGRLDVIPTYTAMIAIRAVIAARTGVGPYWTPPVSPGGREVYR